MITLIMHTAYLDCHYLAWLMDSMLMFPLFHFAVHDMVGAFYYYRRQVSTTGLFGRRSRERISGLIERKDEGA